MAWQPSASSSSCVEKNTQLFLPSSLKRSISTLRDGPSRPPLGSSARITRGEPNRVERVKDSVPMKRGGQASEVAQAILWLLSDEASYTAGSFIEVTGGR